MGAGLSHMSPTRDQVTLKTEPQDATDMLMTNAPLIKDELADLITKRPGFVEKRLRKQHHMIKRMEGMDRPPLGKSKMMTKAQSLQVIIPMPINDFT